jgi:hypothetical protein
VSRSYKPSSAGYSTSSCACRTRRCQAEFAEHSAEKLGVSACVQAKVTSYTAWIMSELKRVLYRTACTKHFHCAFNMGSTSTAGGWSQQLHSAKSTVKRAAHLIICPFRLYPDAYTRAQEERKHCCAGCPRCTGRHCSNPSNPCQCQHPSRVCSVGSCSCNVCK